MLVTVILVIQALYAAFAFGWTINEWINEDDCTN